MPADQLDPLASESGNAAEDPARIPHTSNTEHAVLTALGGTPVAEAADAADLTSAELAEAVQIYRQAGQHALAQQAETGWWQLYLQFTNWSRAEHAFAEHIAPLLHRAEQDGLITGWWFMRKHPCWRLRLYPGPVGHEMKPRLGAAFDDLVAHDRITAWWTGIYEAETAAFGGEIGMDLAHELFCADSRAVANLLGDLRVGLGRRELSLLLCSLLMRATGVEWFEQADVWHRVAEQRHRPKDVSPAALTAMADDLRQLMLADTSADGPLLRETGPLAAVSPWVDAFRRTGQSLGAAARAGTLHRGLRDILAYTVIFHWNRMGLPARTQSILADAARTAVLGEPAARPSPTAAPRNSPATAVVGSDGPTADAANRAIARFPLVRHGRRACPDLETRVREVRTFAHSCSEQTSAEERIDHACSAWNLAALIAADCAVPSMAVELCQRQFELFRDAWPVSGRPAIAALQPLINLARLTQRAGEPDRAYHEFQAINQAVLHGGTATIHGTTVSLDGLTESDTDRATVRHWLNDLLGDEGTRALAASGDWDTAAEHATTYHEDAGRLRAARQTRIIAGIRNGHIDSALALLDASVRNQQWEHGVAACLRSYAHHRAERLGTDESAAMLTAVRATREPSDRPTTLFRLRLGLAAADLAAGANPEAADRLCAELIDEAERSADAFAAREIRDHPLCQARTTPVQATSLTTLVEHAGLDSETIPEPLVKDLTEAVQMAGTVLRQSLRDESRHRGGSLLTFHGRRT